MINLIHADIYRIFRGKGIYITFAVLLAIIILTIFVMREAPVAGIPPEMIIEGMEIEDRQVTQNYMTGATAAQMAVNSMNNKVFFFLPLLTFVAMATFSSGAVKNELTMGISRVKFYFSKWILAVLLSIGLSVLYFVLSVVFAMAVDGVGYWGNSAELLQAFALQSILTVAFVSVGIFLCFVTRRSSAAIVLYIALTIAPSMIVLMIAEGFPQAINALQYDLFSLYFHFAQPGNLQSFELWRSVAVGFGYIIIPAIAGLFIFKKAEIS